jgi:hypothetical protein
MTQTAQPPHVRCPDCGAEATLLPDGAIYCPAENTISQRFPDDYGRRDGEGVHPHHHVELNSQTARRIDREYGYANVGLLVFVVLALIAALVALALVV